MARNILWVFISVFLFSCNSKKEADLIIHNALVYTVDEQFSTVEAFAVKGGKIIELGTSEDILKKYQGKKVDAEGKTIFPGFIDGHAHFYGYGKGLQDADLVGTKSWEEILEKLARVNVKSVQAACQNVLLGKPTLTTLGLVEHVMTYDDLVADLAA